MIVILPISQIFTSYPRTYRYISGFELCSNNNYYTDTQKRRHTVTYIHTLSILVLLDALRTYNRRLMFVVV
jgi:hypothetical protein